MACVWSPAPAATSRTRLPAPTPAMRHMASVGCRSQAPMCSVWAFQPAAALSHWARILALKACGVSMGLLMDEFMV